MRVNYDDIFINIEARGPSQQDRPDPSSAFISDGVSRPVPPTLR